MTEIRFYHLQASAAEQVVPDLLKKAVAQGFLALVKAPTVSRCHFYDDLLWRVADFLPHAMEGDPENTQHHVWISTKDETPNNANMALLVEGVEFPNLNNFRLICNVFDSQKEDHLDKMRQLWSQLKKNDALTLTYWKQQPSGGWAKQAA